MKAWLERKVLRLLCLAGKEGITAPLPSWSVGALGSGRGFQ